MRFRSHHLSTVVKSVACAILFISSSTVIADTHFGVGVSDGDKNLTWVENDVSVSDDMVTKLDPRWNEKEVDDITDINYETYVKSFKLYMVFRRNF
ncbi:MAG: hypothetical protein AMJ53_06350 [Gammaproteobacteria bacterium SG8_11]|nr:MAG: hypothetical protein AMJ53_06350 [Gammaproteobacteria bacterium SG8_11]